MDLQAWKSQLRKGAAEFAVLALLQQRERYGLELLECLRRDVGLEVAEGTIYPLLNRLQRDGKIVARWVEDPDASHPRKYYRLSGDGAALLVEMRRAWSEHTRAMARLTDEEGFE